MRAQSFQAFNDSIVVHESGIDRVRQPWEVLKLLPSDWKSDCCMPDDIDNLGAQLRYQGYAVIPEFLNVVEVRTLLEVCL